MHHLPVKGARFAHDDKVRIHVGDGEARFIQLVDQRAFANHVGFFAFLTLQEIRGRHRRGIKHAVRDIDARGSKAICQILTSL